MNILKIEKLSLLAGTLLLAANLGACSDDDNGPVIECDGATHRDAVVWDAATAQDSGQGGDAEPTDQDGGGQPQCEPGDHTQTPNRRAVITTSLYGSGGQLSVVDLGAQDVAVDVADIPEDSVTRWYDGKLWVLGRYQADNLTILDATDYHMIGQMSLGVGRNPQDIFCVNRCECYVSGLDATDLLVIDPTQPPNQAIQDHIDMSPFADQQDGIPEMTYMYWKDPYLFVTIQRLNRNDQNMPPATNGALAVVDTNTRSLVDMDDQTPGIQGIELPCDNPFSPIQAIPGTNSLLLTCVGSWSDDTCGKFVRVDLDTHQAEAVELDCGTLHGKLTDFTMQDANCGFVVVSDSTDWTTALYHFCLDGTGIEPCLDFGTLTGITDAALTDSGQLLVTDGDATRPGIRIYDPSNCSEITNQVLATGYAPGFADPILLIP